MTLHNFMDRMDGFAGGMAVAGFSARAVLRLMAGRPDLAVPGLVIAAADAAYVVLGVGVTRLEWRARAGAVQ